MAARGAHAPACLAAGRAARVDGRARRSAARFRGSVLTKAQKKTFSSFDDLLANSETPVLVDFYATWCGPCQMMSSELQQVGAELRGQIQVVKIDTEKYPAIATKYQIAGLPACILFM